MRQKITVWTMAMIAVMALTRPAMAGPQLPDLNWEERSDWLNVKTDVTPAAVGDGVADDTAAIQAALNLVKTGGWSVVYMPPGTYRITDTLRLTKQNGLAWIGHGRNTRIVWDGITNSAHGMYWSDGVARCRYVGMVWDGAGKATVGFDHYSTTLFETRVRYQHMAFVNFTKGVGIRTGHKADNPKRSTNSAEIMIENCLFTNCSMGAFMSAHNQYNNLFTGCEFRDCGVGIYLEYAPTIYVWNTHFNRNGRDIYFWSDHSSSARRCTSVGSGQFCVQRAGSGGSGPITLQDCHVSGWTSTAGAIQLTGNTPAMVFDCVFTDPPGTNPPILARGQRHLVVSNNRSDQTADIMARGSYYYSSLTEIPPGNRGGVIQSATQTFFQSAVRIPGKVFDVKRDFGARGDGKSDDSAAVIEAIEAARNYGRGAIAYFPSGTYKVTRDIPVSGSDYTIGGSVGYSTTIKGCQSNGVVFAVRDPRNVTLEQITVTSAGTVAGATTVTNVCAIQQTSSGGNSFMRYDGVYVPGMYWTTNPRPRGLELLGLGKGDVVRIGHLDGELRITDCGRATILADVHYDGQTLVEGTESTRDGFLGVGFRLCTSTSTAGVTVSNNYSLVMGEYYAEGSKANKGNLLICGAPGEPAGRVTIHGAKICSSTNPLIHVANYQGHLFYGPQQFYGNFLDPLTISQSGARPVWMIFMANVSIANKAHPSFNLNTNAAQLVLIENNWTNNVIPDGGLRAAAYGLDHLRELGEMDVRLRYSAGKTNVVSVPAGFARSAIPTSKKP